MADSLSAKARAAKNAATKDAAKYAAGDTVIRNAEAAGIKDLSTAEFKKARKTLQPRIRLDRQRTAARAAGIEKMQAKKTAAKRAAAAIGNPEIKVKDAMAKPKAGMTLKEFEKKIKAKPKASKPEKYENTRAAKAKADKAKAKIKKDFGKK
jgi:hypothetical protein